MGWPVSTRVTTDNRVAVGNELSHNATTPDRMALFFRIMLISLLKTKPKKTLRIYHTQIRNQQTESEAVPIVLFSYLVI